MRCSRRNCPEERGPESGVHSHLSASKLNRLDAEADLNWLQADGFRALFPGLTVRDNVYLACRGVSRGRFSPLRPGANDALMHAAEALIQAVHLTPVRERLVAELAHGQQRQLEIALALAGAPRFILFDELSPTERRELIEILTSLPAHIGYIIIEHDMDVALRVVESVTMMHNGRVFKEGLPHEIEADPEVQELYLGAGHE